MREAEVAGQLRPPGQRAEHRVQLLRREVADHDLQAGQISHGSAQQVGVDVIEFDISQGKLGDVRRDGH